METLSPSSPLWALTPLLKDPLVVVDIGARWGFSSVWEELGDKCLRIGFEPDAAEYERLVEIHAGQSNVRFAPHALGARPGLATLYLTRNRGGCSVFRPSEDAMRRHPGLEGAFVEGTTIIEMTTLDDWCAAEGVERVDAIKIDTQGSELAILEGASRVLRSVRSVEVEVEFNELYDDIPLFGDIDRFLRSQGFVLWKLRDLAHYAQAGVPTEWRNVEACHYDTGDAAEAPPGWFMATFRGGPGQLFWANAFYLRKEVAYAEPSVGWEQLTRDACLTRTHNFVDLSMLALELARREAPEDVRATIDLALGPEAERFRRELQPGRALTETLKVPFEDPKLSGGGWQPVQIHDWGGIRWTGPGRDAWVDVPVVLRPGTRVEILSVAAMSSAIEDGLAAELNGARVQLSRSPHQRGTLFSGVVPWDYSSARPFTRVMLRTPAAIPWNEVHPESDDDLELGIAVAWLRFTPPT
jgi:FkbM family methyltransferase